MLADFGKLGLSTRPFLTQHRLTPNSPNALMLPYLVQGVTACWASVIPLAGSCSFLLLWVQCNVHAASWLELLTVCEFYDADSPVVVSYTLAHAYLICPVTPCWT